MPTDAAPVAPATLSLDLSDESATTALFRAAIGPVGAGHYLPVFARFELADRAGSGWNWAACLCTVGWMLFRRLWGAALVYVGVIVGVGLIVSVALGLIFHAPEQVQLGVGLAMLLGAFVVPGVWGDAWLYTHCRKRMARALADSSSWAEAAALLDKEALARPRAWWLAGAHAAVLGAMVTIYLVLPDSPFPAPGTTPGAEAVRVPESPTSAASEAPAVSPASAAVPAASATAPALAPVSAPASAPLLPSASASAAASASPAVAPASAASSGAAPAAPGATLRLPAPAATASAPSMAASATYVPQPRAANALGGPLPAASAPLPVPSSQTVAAPAETPAGRYIVNVGLFAVDTNARKAESKLRGAGLKVMVQELQTSNGKRTRVRAGPYRSKSQAEAAAEKIRALGLEAQVARQPG